MNTLWRRLVRLERARHGGTVTVIRVIGGLPGARLETATLGNSVTLHRGEGEDDAAFEARAADEAKRRGLAWVVIGGLPAPAAAARLHEMHPG